MLTEEMCAGWRARVSLDKVLSLLVQQTGSRASGCWRLENGCLQLIGFGWAENMPAEVSQGFQDATRCVPLDQTGLGIVKAAVSEVPTIGRRDPQSTGLDGSASWIVQFEANSSLAVPIHDRKRGCVVGVLAVSTAAFVSEGDELWQTLVCLSEELGSEVG